MAQKNNSTTPACTRQPVTPARRETFLKTLSRTGSFGAAARAASPTCKTSDGAISTFRQLVKRDPDFAEAVAEAKAQATAELEKVAFSRATRGVKRPVVSNGKVVTYVHEHDNRLLMRLLVARDPARYRPGQDIHHSGRVDSACVGLVITPQNLMHLDETEVATLESLVEKIAQRREEVDG